MGAIGGEELTKWEKMQEVLSGGEEKILVLVRLRPLSEKEIARNEVSDWECINETSILFRNSLQDRSMFPTAYTFDRVFSGDCSTWQVYEEGAKEIALSVVSGINWTIVEKITEVTLRDWGHLKELLSICEAQRKIGETSLNETSSRSHQILRLTIESSAREFLGKDNSTTLAASVNFVDLAGSERASQALSVGARLKEGCHINRSLLTLGTVIRKLSKGRHGHVNYRDSKLTRILQPCLGGNARTAIICTLSPARSHVEQSRNTLLFATCAKEVTTNAKVNVVMSDKALVKHLQRELSRLESELRTPAPSSNCDYAALLKKKDLQIEKLEKEVRELTKQRNLAESRVEDLLRIVGNDQGSRQWGGLSQEGNKWEDECSVSESSGMADTHFLHIEGRKFGTAESSNIDYSSNSEEPSPNLQGNGEDDSLSNGPSSPLSDRGNTVRSGAVFALGTGEDLDDICKEVRCIEMDESLAFINCPCPNDSSPWAHAAGMSSSRSQKLNRSLSCRANLMAGSSSPYFQRAGESQNTPPNGFEKSFPGRPEGFQKLSRNDSQSSIGSAFVHELKARENNNSLDEDIPSIDTFVAGLKEMAKLEYEKQLADCQGTEPKAEKAGKNVKDVGLDPMQDTPETPASWPLEFERRQKAIIELWQSCNISLVHRTYFFLLFKGDSMDSIYMEVELRRLSFLKEAFSRGNHAVEAEERNRLYQKWNIGLGSKRRRLQLVNRLWSNTNDKNHVVESAAIVGTLIRFSEQGQALKEMFGLSFTPPRTSRRSLGWKRSMANLL
ncbi:ATP binding microtubule motor family protein [Actinidia rufa]|uniref:Kinesin-like protein n=1 Tax=Actinidia rufa TaxID=165716 RepID=A0A7J0ETS2_9ERIC|nr:ATP binding microtubule motor family protein [Actinidia rufa]